MSVLIKGMEMPKCCSECFALDDSGDYPFCLITQETRGYTFHRREVRMPKCPLVGVPPHGRLIDADAIPWENQTMTYDDEWAIKAYDLEQMPTVIEAEEDE